MSMFGNIAQAGYVAELLKWIEENEQYPDFVERLKLKLRSDKQTMDAGWY